MWETRSNSFFLYKLQFKKLTRSLPVGRLQEDYSNSKTTTPSSNDIAVLNYVLAHAKGDQRPYLRVDILGINFLGLLDSGASRTILGGPGWDILKGTCVLDSHDPVACKVANGEVCESIGTCSIPMRLEDRVGVINVLIVPSLPHKLILGIDFWKHMGIIPDLYTDMWSFRQERDVIDSVNTVGIHGLDSLTDDQRKSLWEMLDKAFSDMGDTLGCTHLVEHVIHTSSPPIKQRYYPLSPALQKEVNAELDDMLRNDIIEPSKSPWSSPIVMVKKSDGKWRFCVNYKRLNAVSTPDAYPIPYVSGILDKLRDARYLSTLDIKSAYWQIPVAKESRPLTAFTVPNRGLFQFKRMPFGLHSAPSTWQRLIDQVLRVDLESKTFVYLDDVIICTATFQEHLEVLEIVINRIKEAGLTLNREKCLFCRSELKYLGYVINGSGLLVDPEKVEAILKIPTPRCVREVRRIVGMASWYRRFIPNFSSLMSPLTRLTEKNQRFRWDDTCEDALNNIKQILVKAPILACPDFTKPFIVETDASDYGLGATLCQKYPDGDRVVCYLSRSLTKTERKYSTTEKECLAVIFAVEKLRPYLEGSKFVVVTDHYSLKWLFDIKDPVGRIARWTLRLQAYDFEVVHRKGKEHLVPDALSRAVPCLDAVEPPSTNTPTTSDKWYLEMLRRVRSCPRKYSLWMIYNNKLYRHSKRRYPDLAYSEWLMVVPRENRQDIIRDHHDPPTAGHLGVSKTLAKINQKYYWPKMIADVARYVRRCSTCQRTKPEQNKPKGQTLSPQVTASRPWEIVSTDLVGPLPRTTTGYSFIYTVMDCFSKFILAFPLRSATAANVARILEDQVILVYGAPRKIIVDNGVQFRSVLFKDLMNKYRVEIQFTALYHPQANPVERAHRVIKTMLTAYVSDDQRHWDQYLQKIVSAIRSSKHESTGFTPNLINFGREILLNGLEDNDFPLSVTSDIEEKSLALNKLFKEVKKKLFVAYQRSKQPYNLRHRNEKFVLGQSVWKRNYVVSDASKQFTAKLAPKFIGPFKISKIVSPWSYELVDSNNNKSIGIWNAKDLKSKPPDND